MKLSFDQPSSSIMTYYFLKCMAKPVKLKVFHMYCPLPLYDINKSESTNTNAESYTIRKFKRRDLFVVVLWETNL